MLKKAFLVIGMILAASLVFLAAFPGLSSRVCAEEEAESTLEMRLGASEEDPGILLKSSGVDGKQYFFLPSGVTEEVMTPLFEEDVPYERMQSANVASLHFFSGDPDKDIAYVHAVKGNTAPGEVFLFDENFGLLYQGKVDALKGRGNTTWTAAGKKSYQLKLAKKADLLDPQGGSQKAKKWILLANPFDPTLMRNQMIYDFARELGLQNTPEGRPVDFYYDGEYRGSYYLCEKVEIGDGRVEIDELEKAVEKANPDVDLDALPEVTGHNSKGYNVHYEEGITDPDDISGGYLVELDSVYYTEEKSWFQVFSAVHASVKSPEYTSAAMIDYISGIVEDFYNYCRHVREGKTDGSELASYIDLDSFARYFLVNEWFANNDVWTSSTFMYKPKGDDLLYAGPVWDCDSSLQIRNEERIWDQWFAEESREQPLGELLMGVPAFRKKIQEIYDQDMRKIIFDILLGTESGAYLRPAEVMKAELAASAAMDHMIWEINDCDGSYFLDDTPEETWEKDLAWMKKRAEWFDGAIMEERFVSGAEITRIYGTTRYETSLKAADELKKRLDVQAFNAVILACGGNYADALSGSYLASVLDAPILLVDEKKSHISAVQNYIRENLAADGRVYVLGGTAAIPEKVLSGLSDYEVLRLWGKTRYETNIAILKEAGKFAETPSEILICSGESFADSLSAAASERPILLVKTGLQNAQKEYLNSLNGETKITVIGGTKAVSSSIEEALASYGKTSRIGGSSRYETSVLVAETFFKDPEACVLAYGENFPDGLSGGVLANAMGGPLILASSDKTKYPLSYVSSVKPYEAIVLGGPSLISDTAVRKVFWAVH